MTDFNGQVGAFGGIFFGIGSVPESSQPSTLKTKIGKTFVEKEIPLRNTVDIVLRISGVIDGRSQTSGQTKATAIENDRASLIALNDGFKHAYSDGKHSFDGAITPGSLQWSDEATRSPGEPYKFTMEIKEWN